MFRSGTVALEVRTGLAHGVLVPGDGYELARAEVEGARPNSLTEWHECATLLVFGAGGFCGRRRVLRRWGNDLQDLRGTPVSAASVSVFAPLGFEHQPFVVVDFRPQAAQVLAVLRETDGTGDGRRRPAA